MKVRGKIVGLDLDFISHKPKLTLQLNNQELVGYDDIKNLDELDITIEKPKKKRTLNANNYLWQLINEIANVLGSTKEEIYREAIKDKGKFEIIPIKDEAVDKFTKAWQKDGLGNICEIKGKSKLEGYTNVICYFGSSTYDSKEFYYLTEYIVEEAKGLGIETMTPQEIMALERII